MTTRPRAARTPQHERRARTRAALLDAAGRVFAAEGFHGATLDQVAAAAELSKGALYHHFASKEQLFLALLEERLRAGLSDMEAVVAEHGTGSPEMAAAAETFLRRASNDPRWMPLLLEFLAYGSRDESARNGVIVHFLRPPRERVAALVRTVSPQIVDRAALDADELGVAIAALINGLAIERSFDPHAVPQDLLPRLVAVIREGLEASRAERTGPRLRTASPSS